MYVNHDIQPFDESVLPCPINHYGNMKLCIENVIRTFNYQMNKNMIIARISNPYGPGQDFHSGVGFIDAVLKKAIENEPIEIWGDGKNIRDYIYIEDVCRMLKSLLEYQGKIDTFNISSGVGSSQNEIVQIARRLGLDPKIVYREKRSVDERKIILDNDKIMNIFAGRIKTLNEGIRAYYHFLKKN